MAAEAAGLRIGIDGTCLASGRGYGRFLRELLPPLLAQAGPHQYLLFVDAETAEQVALPEMPIARLGAGESQAAAASARGSRGLGDMLRMGLGVARAPLDAFYFPSVYSYFPVPSRLPIAVAIHDTIPERHGAIVFPNAKTRLFWQAKSRAARWQARTIVTVSEYARRQLADVFGIAAERIFVTPEAPSPAFAPPADAAPRAALLTAHGVPTGAPYFVYLGGFNPHKNVSGLVRSLATLRGEALPHLLLVGDAAGDVFHGNVGEIRRAIAETGLGARVHWTGFVADTDLCQLFAGALAVVLPAFEEGFGLPAVEGAACGTPCIATQESPLPEVLAGAGLFFDPRDPAALARALAQLAHDRGLRARLAAAALVRARALSWDITARETRRALEATAR